MKYFIFFFALIPLTSHAVGYVNIGYPEGVFYYDNQAYLKYRDDVTKIYPDLENKVSSSKTVDIPTSKGRVPVTINQKTPVAIPKVGKAVSNFLKKGLPVVGTAVAVYELACELGAICHDPNDGHLKKKEDAYPPVTPLGSEFQLQNGNWTSSLMDACQSTWPPAYYEIISTDPNYSDTGATCGYRVISSGFQSGGIVNKRTQCPPQYFPVGNQCEIKPEYLGSSYRPLVESDYDNPAFNTPSVVTPLIDAGEPVPMDAPQTPVKIVPMPSQTETTRDGEGTATGTKTTNRDIKIEPTSKPDVVKVTEITNVTNTNITNNTTNTTTTINEPPPEEIPQEEETIEFDTVPEIDLPTHDFTPDFTPMNFGGGSCPPDPTFTISKGTYILPFHHACDFAAMIKTVFLLLCALTSAFIIAGARND